MDFSEKIKQYRRENNLTQEAFAKKLKISRQAVSKWEQGRGYPDIKTIEELSRLMGVSIDGLISNQESKTLTVDSANKISGTLKKYFIAVCSISIVLVIVLSAIIGILVIKPKSNLKGLVGFYIDISQDDGELSLYQPNSVDIYFYKLAGAKGGYVKNGILNDKTTSMQYIDGTSYFFAECEIVLDLNIKADSFILYDVVEGRYGHLSAIRRQAIKHTKIISTLANIPSPSIYFTNNDYISYDGKNIGRTFNFYLTYKTLPTQIKIVQYSDNEYGEIIDEQIILASTKMPDVPHPQLFVNTVVESEGDFIVRILGETQSYKVFETAIIDGLEVEYLVSSQNFMVSMTGTREICFANKYGYVSKMFKLIITNQ